MYIRLKTDHSLLESTLNVQMALQLTCDAELPFFAICETGHFGSIAQAYALAQKKQIFFIAAIELHVEIDSNIIPFVIICKNHEGYQELLRYHHLFQKPIDIELLKSFESSNLFLIPVLNHVQVDYVERLKQHFPFEYAGLSFSEYIQPFEVERIKAIEQKHEVLFCMMNSIVMKDEKSHKTRAVLQAIKTNSREIQIDTSSTNTFLQRDQIATLVENYPELMHRNEQIARLTNFTLEGSKKIPKYPFVGEDTSDVLLQKLVIKGATRRYLEMTESVKQRIRRELSVISELGFADYFLILWDAKRYAFQHDILFGPGRGSSVGSIVAFCLGITEIDPLAYGLVFERFLNPGRRSYPDIDIDVADDKRDALISYVRNRYGEDKVAHILTYGTFGAKSAFREVARIHGLSQVKIGEVTKYISHNKKLIESYKESQQLQTLLTRDTQLLQCYKIALQIEGLKRNISTHAAGIIITDDSLFTQMPIFVESGCTTAWEMKELEAMGFLKIDFLGLKNLSILDKLEQTVLSEEGTFQMQEIPLQDTKTYEYLALGLTNGIFQLESDGIKKVLRDLKPTQFEDVVAVLALYRPGPMESIPLFIARKHGELKVEMPHADLAPILSETYGVIVYQEQIMQIVHVMARFDFAAADDFRRAISKKNETLLKSSLQSFEAASIANGYEVDVVKQVSDLMLQFANYGFVKGHAVAYAMIAYRLMYFKTHYARAFYMVLLNHHLQDVAKITTYVQEMKRRKILLLPPDIMLSTETFKIEKSGIRMGLCSIKGIGRQTAQQIITIVLSSVETTADGIIRALLRNKIAKEHIEALICVGAFDRFQVTRQTLVMLVKEGELGGEYKHLAGLVDLTQKISHYPEYELKDCEHFEREYLGYPFFQNVFVQFEKEYAQGQIIPLQTLRMQTTQTHQTVARVVSLRKHRNGKTYFIQLEDNTGEISAVVFDFQVLQGTTLNFGEVYHLNVKCSIYKGKTSYQIVKISPIVS